MTTPEHQIKPGEAVLSTPNGWRLHIAGEAERTLCGRWVYESAHTLATNVDCGKCLVVQQAAAR